MPNRVLKDQNYRFGFNGKEADREGQWGSTEHYDYGFRIYDPKIARFLSVDPLTSSYPWYTPYQFAGNKPIKFIDLDGLEEYDPAQDPLFVAELFYTTATDVLDAIANTAISINDAFSSTKDKANRIRKIAASQGSPILLSEFSNEDLVSNIEVKFTTKGKRGYQLDRIGNFGEEMLEGLENTISIVGVLGGFGGGPVLAARAPASALRITETLTKADSKQIGDIAKDMRKALDKGEDPWEFIPAIDVVNDNGTLLIVDGMHRASAAKFLGTDVKYNEISVSLEDLNDLRVGASTARVKTSSSVIRKIINNE